MLATFVIGLREGLEAALIVGIIAAFLRRNGRPLTPMWIGVCAALGLSVAVGVTLVLVEQSLPQAAQEGMESVIGAIAVAFVTSMIVWMSTHARGMKRELETNAQAALGDGTSTALAVMAFLAVLKEGFETSVFLLATFQAASSTVTAAIGALLGILVSAGLGFGLYRGSLKLNLAKFFTVTSSFLVLVAAGLVVTTLRTAHAAGWLLAGQERTVDLSWLAPVGSVRSSLFTGVLGIPADPRLIEVVGWLCYLVPMGLIVLWPMKRRPGREAARRIRYAVAAVLVLAAGGLALGARTADAVAPAGGTMPLVDPSGAQVGTAQLVGRTLTLDLGGTGATPITLPAGTSDIHAGVAAEHVSLPLAAPTDQPPSLTAAQVAALNGGRVPNIDVQRSPGPYDAAWKNQGTRDVWLTTDAIPRLLDVAQKTTATLTLSGGGLTASRTITVADATGTPTSWSASPSSVDTVVAGAEAARSASTEAGFWGRTVPVLLLLAALAVLVVAQRRARPVPAPSPRPAPVPASTSR